MPCARSTSLRSGSRSFPQAPAPAFWKRPAEEVAAVRERYELPDRYLLWVGTMRRPDPRKRVAALARAERSMPLVLVGPVSRWARELRGVLAGRATLSDVDDLDCLVRHAEGLSRPAATPAQRTWGDVAAATWEVYERALRTRSPGSRRAPRHL